jgi:hypothetical protein
MAQMIGGIFLSEELFIKADEVAQRLGVSKPYAYKLIRQLNEELRKEGFITISGRVSRAYFQEKIYGKARVGEEKVKYGSL